MKVSDFFLSVFLLTSCLTETSNSIKMEIEKTIDQILEKGEKIFRDGQGFLVVNILEFEPNTLAFSVSYIYNQWDLESMSIKY